MRRNETILMENDARASKTQDLNIKWKERGGRSARFTRRQMREGV